MLLPISVTRVLLLKLQVTDNGFLTKTFFVFEKKKIKGSNYFIWRCVLIISNKCVFIVSPMDQLQSTMIVIGYICICILQVYVRIYILLLGIEVAPVSQL